MWTRTSPGDFSLGQSPYAKARPNNERHCKVQSHGLFFLLRHKVRERNHPFFQLLRRPSEEAEKMWASAEGGAPEVTLETSMGSFTVEVLFPLFNFVNFCYSFL